MMPTLFGMVETPPVLLVVLALLVILMVVGACAAVLIIWLIKRSEQPAAAPRVAKQPRRACPQCGAALAADAPEGLCPQCLLKAGLGSRADASGETVDVSQAHPEPAASKAERTWGATPPEPKELGKLFPKLEVLELLGRGGMGAVYKARQPSLDRLVALKILPPESGRDPAFAERFVREARALAKLNHPNIVAVYDFGQTGEYYYFVMEFVDGVNLRQLEQAGKRTPAEALAMIPKICDALQFAHEEGVVHRDIKPENILVDKKGRVKIADFGLAKILGREQTGPTLTNTGAGMGTLRYMAPEQIENAKTVDHRADIYSLGVVFYEMLTGELPLGRFAPPSQKSQIDVRLDEVVLHTLEKEPARRYQHASEVKTAVESIASSGAPLAAGKPGNWLGHLSLWTAIAGLVLPILLAIGGLAAARFLLSLELSEGYILLCWALGFVLELVALGCGIVARRTGTGKAGLIIGSISLLLYVAVYLAVFTIGEVRHSPRPEAVPEVVETREVEVQPSSVTMLKKSFTTSERTISKDVVVEDGAWVANCAEAQTIRLFELPGSGRDECTVFYRAMLKTEGLKGRAYLEMWCRVPGRGEFFSRGLNNSVTGSTDWASYEVPFVLNKGEKADLIRLNVAVEGTGKIWIRNVEWARTSTIHNAPDSPKAVEQSRALPEAPYHSEPRP